MDLTPVVLGFDAVLLAATVRFTCDAAREQETHAVRVGSITMALLLLVGVSIVSAKP